MKENAKKMLEAIRDFGCNHETREMAIAVLEARRLPFDANGLGAEELATKGILGGFIQAVMTGDIEWARCKADSLNRLALDMAGIK